LNLPKKIKLVYVALKIDSAFHSQVLELLNYFSSTNNFESITLIVACKLIELKKYNLDKLNNINIVQIKTYPQLPFYLGLTKKAVTKALKKLDINHNTIIHTRNEYAGHVTFEALVNFNIFDKNLIVDVRGAPSEASIYTKDKLIAKKILRKIFLKKVHSIFDNDVFYSVVSPRLKTHLVEDYNVNPDKISINSCISGEQFSYNSLKRLEIRKALNLSKNDILFLFSTGGDGLWQKTNDIIREVTKKGYKLLILSKKIYIHKGVISKYVNYSEVYSYLSAADVGVVFREDNIVNNVASPIKFSEYIASGLPVIANESVNLIKDIIKDNNVGLITDNFNNLDKNKIIQLLGLDRKKTSKLGRKLFNVKTIGNSYLTLYKRVLHK
jgi:glycosyltransferase involved in cell wall biosynthesis